MFAPEASGVGVPVVVDAVATGTPAGLGDSAPVAVGGGGSWWCSIFTGLDLNFILNVRQTSFFAVRSKFCDDFNYYAIGNSTIANI